MRKMIFLLFFLIFVTSNSFSKPSIQSLTSRETASTVESDLPSSESYGSFNNRHWISTALGQTHLMGDFYKTGDNAMGYDIFYNYIASSQFDFTANFHYSEHERNDEWLKLPSFNVGIKYKFYEKDSLNLFTLGGLGFYYPKAMHSDGIETESRATAGIHVGTGIDLKLNPDLGMGFMGHFHKPFTIKQENTRDVSGAYFNLMTYLSYNFL